MSENADKIVTDNSDNEIEPTRGEEDMVDAIRKLKLHWEDSMY